MAAAIAARANARLDRRAKGEECDAFIAASSLAAALLIGAAPPAKKLLTPNDIVAAAPASAWKTISRRRPAGHRPRERRPRRGPARARPSRRSTSPTSRRWRAAIIGTARPSIGCRTIMSRNGASTTATSRGPPGVIAKPPAEYTRPLKGLTITPLGSPDPYAPGAGFADGWPVAYSPRPAGPTSPIATAASASAATSSPDTGTGGELYAVIGHAPRQLDRNIALVGRVVEGIDQLELAAARDRGARLLQGQGAVRADRQRSGWPATCPRPSGRPIEYMDTRSATLRRYLQAARQPARRFLHPPGGRRRPVQRPGAGAEEAPESR